MSTKDFSNAQEHMIAKYLGWKVVSGSGARPFHVGDVWSDEWLGECKTHVKVGDKVTFYAQHWRKICREADSCMKKPILITDFGTQQPEDTFVVFNEFHADLDTLPIRLVDRIHDGVNISFDPEIFHEALKSTNKQGIVTVLCSKRIVITTLKLFKEMLERI